MEQGAVHDGAETTVVAGEVADVGDLEAGAGQAATGGLLTRQLDRGGRLVQAHRGEPALRQVQRDRGLATPGVQHVAVELAGLDEGRDLGLRFADAPRRPGALAHLG